MEIIHIVLGKANPDRLNGVNNVVYHLAMEQYKAGKNVQVWGITSTPLHDYPERNFHTKLYMSEKFPFAINEEIKKDILKNKTAVYHLHGGWIPVFSRIAMFFAKHKIKYVVTGHGAYNEIAMRHSAIVKRAYFYLFEKMMLKNAHKIHAIGKSEVQGLKNILPKVNSFLLPYGFVFNQGETNSLKNDEFTIGFLGRLDTKTKGLDLLVEAFYLFQKLYPYSQLWIIGEGEGLAYLKSFIVKKKLNNIRLLGKKFGEEKNSLLSKMHVFVHPSRNEGLPTAVLEAAALGLPTIVTKATNMGEYITEYNAGISIENDDIIALEKSMERIYSAYQMNKAESLAMGAKKMIESAFDWPILVQKYDDLYQ